MSLTSDVDIQILLNNRAVKEGTIPEFICEVVRKIVDLYPQVVEIWLIGSYADGSFIDEYSTEHEIQRLKQLGKKGDISDIDFFTSPVILKTNLLINGREVDLLPETNANNRVICSECLGNSTAG